MIATAFDNIQSLPTTLKTVDEFEQWASQPGHDGNFEFINGHIIPKPGMKQDEFDLVAFLQGQFAQTSVAGQRHLLLPEADSYVDSTRKRIPDLAYITAEQRQTVRRGERVSTLFAIEILSDSESYQDVLKKIQDYFDAGAQLVWYIVPELRRIYAYTSPDEVKTYKAADMISASPVITDFSFTVADLFA
jgi:Uma2 family endonuclease